MRRNLRILQLTLTVLAAVAFVAASAGLWHGHSDGAAKACQVCHVAHLPALGAVSGAQVAPPVVIGFHTPAEDIFLHAAPVVSNAPARAPPSVL